MSDSVRVLSVGLACALLLLVGAPVTQATTMVYYGTEKLLEDCSFLVFGRVTAVQSAYHDAVHGGSHHEIYTFTTIAIDRSWREGVPAGSIVIEEVGGSVGARVSTVDGLPTFAPGAEVLLFVERRPDGHFKTFGMYLGALTVQRDADDRAFLVRPDVPARTRVVDTGYARDLIEPDAQGRFSLDTFLTAVDRHESGKGR
jgi:hypothetical protein